MKEPRVINRLLFLAVSIFSTTIAIGQSTHSSAVAPVKTSLYSYTSALDTLTYKQPLGSSQSQLIQPFAVKKMPFFCLIEHNIAKKSGFPVKFRLGDVNYVDKLENK